MALIQGAHNINSAVTGSGIFVGTDTLIITFPREFVSGDTIGWTIDGTLITTTFATTSNAMLDAILADFVAITGSVSGGKVITYSTNPRIEVQGVQEGHEIVFTLPTGTTDLANSTLIQHSGVRELALLVANPTDVLKAIRVAVDSGTATLEYVGTAAAGSLNAEAVWSIQRINTASGTVVEWADGNTSNDNIWSNRESLSYS